LSGDRLTSVTRVTKLS